MKQKPDHFFPCKKANMSSSPFIDPSVCLDVLGIGMDLSDGLVGLLDGVGDDATGNEAVGAEFIPDSNMIEKAQCVNVKPSRRNTIHRCPGQVNGMPCARTKPAHRPNPPQSSIPLKGRFVTGFNGKKRICCMVE